MLRSFANSAMAAGNAIILAEANVLPKTDMEYFGGDGDRMHMMFNFHVNQHLFYALASADLGRSRNRWPHKTAAGHGAMGCFCESRRTRPRALTKAQREAVSRRSVPTRTCSSTTAASEPAGADAGWRPTADRARL